jgi:VWFA-related protein
MPRRFARSAGAFALAAGLLALALGGGKLPTVAAQLTGQNKPPSDEPTKTISVQVRLVVEAVTVKDKKGNPIDGLSAKDFTITEDGVAQKISFCEHQTLPETAAPLPPSPAGDDIKIYNRLGRTQVSAESAGQIKYKDHRLLALYFDMSAMPPEDQMRALAAAEKFVRKDMTEADLLAIMRYNAGSMDVLQDFTADRNRILSILAKVRATTNPSPTTPPPTPVRPSARTTRSSTSSPPTANWPRCRRPPRRSPG